MRYILFLLLLVFIFVPVQAQSDWQIVLYVEQEGAASYTAELQVITLAGVQEVIPLPEALSAPTADYTFGAFVSDDLRFVALYQQVQSPDNGRNFASLRMYNRADNECCYDIGAAVEGAVAFNIAGFAPNASAFAFSYIKDTFFEPDAGGMMIADAATGQISQNIPMSLISKGVSTNESDTWVLMGDWISEGILFVPFCYACDAFLNQEYSLYEPQSGNFREKSGVYPGDYLDATGELIQTGHDTRYSYSMVEGMFPPSNVVQYSADGSPASASDPVIFASEDIINIRDVVWVADGQAVLVESFADVGLWQIVWRDGRILPVKAAGLSHQGGTPNGWLASRELNNGDGQLLHFDAQTMEGSELIRIAADSTYRIIQRPVLGQNVSAMPFVPIPPPERPVAYCPNFLPSRLVVGDTARVTPGAPNRLRARPVNGDTIGQIPGGAEFSVIGEPFCDEFEGILWWEVDYQGLVGWTAEGQGSEYWVEPVNVGG